MLVSEFAWNTLKPKAFIRKRGLSPRSPAMGTTPSPRALNAAITLVNSSRVLGSSKPASASQRLFM